MIRKIIIILFILLSIVSAFIIWTYMNECINKCGRDKEKDVNDCISFCSPRIL